MIWKVWTVSLFGRVVMTVRLDAVGWPVEAEHELQRARAAGSQQPPAASAPTAEKEHAQTQTRAAAEDVVLDVATLTEWYRTRPHVRDAERVARAAVRRGIGDDEADEIREWVASRRRTQQSATVSETVITDAEREWIIGRR